MSYTHLLPPHPPHAFVPQINLIFQQPVWQLYIVQDIVFKLSDYLFRKSQNFHDLLQFLMKNTVEEISLAYVPSWHGRISVSELIECMRYRGQSTYIIIAIDHDMDCKKTKLVWR